MTFFQEHSDKIEDQKRLNSCHNIFESDEDFQRDFLSEFSRPKSVGTIPKSRRKLSTNISDPCLLSCLPSDVNGLTDRSTNTSELNSVDSGIPEDTAVREHQIYS